MKQQLLALSLLLLTACTAFYFVSCKKEKVYSCNEALNNYAKVTLQSNQVISRDKLAQMGIDTQFAIFNSLSSGNKVRIMKEKIQLLLDMDTVPEADKTHLEKISDYMSGAIYDTNIEADTFINNWMAYAHDVLQWDEIRMGIYVYTWLVPDEMFGRRGNSYSWDKANTDGGGGGGNKLPCVCNYSWFCGAWDCVKGGCEVKGGCGLFGWNDCKGECKP